METITRSEFEKFRFCTRYWDANGGAVNKRPYWDEIGTETTGKRQRVYLNTLWYRDWATFSPAADRALTAACVQYDAYHDHFVKIGTAYPFDEKPRFLLEPEKWPNTGEYSIWVNCLCPDEASFNATLSEARERIENHGKPVAGKRIASITDPLPMLPFPSEWCQCMPRTVGASWRK